MEAPVQVKVPVSPVFSDFVKAAQEAGLFKGLKLHHYAITRVSNTVEVLQTCIETNEPANLFLLGERWGIHQMRMMEANGGELPKDDETAMRVHKEVLVKQILEKA